MKYCQKTCNVTTKGENQCIAMHFITIYILAGLGIGCMLMLIITDEHPAYAYSTTDVARCRDGDVSRVSLKYDAAECSPGLLSMEWYPSLFLEFFHHLVFPCRHTCSSETHGTIPTSLLVFVENVFTFLILCSSVVDHDCCTLGY